MALAVSRRLCLASFRSKLLTDVSRKPYHCYILTKTDHKDILMPKWSGHEQFPLVRIQPYYKLCEPSRQYSSDSSESSKQNEAQKGEQTLSLFQRFKQMYRDYWYVLVPVHLVTSAAWFGGFYYLASSGFDIPALLESMNFSEKIVTSMRNSSMGYYAIAYALYKIATPVRYTVTLGGTTVSIKYLKEWGYIKPMPSKERLKEMYAETKEGMKEKRENLMESVQSLQKTVKETKEGIKGTKDSIVTSVKKSKKSIKNIKHKVVSGATQKNGK